MFDLLHEAGFAPRAWRRELVIEFPPREIRKISQIRGNYILGDETRNTMCDERRAAMDSCRHALRIRDKGFKSKMTDRSIVAQVWANTSSSRGKLD